MKVRNEYTGKEHVVTKETYETWISAGFPITVVEVEKPTAIKEKESKPEADKT